jgi:hypothetical protein
VPLAANVGCTDQFPFADAGVRNPPACARWVDTGQDYKVALVFGIIPSEDSAFEETPTDVEDVRSRVNRVLAVEAGDNERLTHCPEDAEWAPGCAGHGHILTGGNVEADTAGDGGFGSSGIDSDGDRHRSHSPKQTARALP